MRSKSGDTSVFAFKLGFLCVLFIIEILLLMLVMQWLKENAALFYFVADAAGAGVILAVSARRGSIKGPVAAWVMLSLFLPLLVFIPFFLWGRVGSGGRKARKLLKAGAKASAYMSGGEAPECRAGRGLALHGFSAYPGTDCTYYSDSFQLYSDILKDIKCAEKFVLIECYAISGGILWDKFKALLVEKAALGVEIKIICDDVGTAAGNPYDAVARFSKNTMRELVSHGIKVARFNPVGRGFSAFKAGYRNRRGAVVVDGRVAYVGGFHIADAYAVAGGGRICAARLAGQAVRGVTVPFLSFWEGETGESLVYNLYEPTRDAEDVPVDKSVRAQPFAEGPAFCRKGQSASLTVYKNAIYGAVRYVYLFAPRAVFDGEVADALITAAVSGADVRVISSAARAGLWDDKYARMAARGGYKMLLDAGVRVFEHSEPIGGAAAMVCDGEWAVVGGAGFDGGVRHCYYENAAVFYGLGFADEVKRHFDGVMATSHEIKLTEWSERPGDARFLQAVSRLFCAMFG